MKRRPYQPRRLYRALADLNQAFADLKARTAARQQRSNSAPAATAGQSSPRPIPPDDDTLEAA